MCPSAFHLHKPPSFCHLISSHLHKPPSLCPSASHLHKPKEWHPECFASTTSTAVSVLFPASVDTGMTPVPSSTHTVTTAGKLPEQPTTVHPRTQLGDSGERTPKGRPQFSAITSTGRQHLMPRLPFQSTVSIALPNQRSNYPWQFWFPEYSIEWYGQIGQGAISPHPQHIPKRVEG